MKKITKSKMYKREYSLNGIKKPEILLKEAQKYIPLINTIEKQSVFEKIIDFIINGSWKAIKILYYVIKIIGYLTMTVDKKQTYRGVISAIIGILAVLGVNIAPDLAENITVAAVALIAIIVGFIGKDSQKGKTSK